MKILRLGEAVHEDTYEALRPKGHECYLLILTLSSSFFEVNGSLKRVKKGSAVVYRPGQRHHYKADGEPYQDFWMHIVSDTELFFEGFPFGEPVPLREEERFFQLFRILIDEFFSNRRTRESVLYSLSEALFNMLASEVEIQDGLFGPFLSLRKQIFLLPEKEWKVERESKEIGISAGYFHALYKKFFHTTFVNDVIESRIEKAKELLLATRKSVEKISEECGYLNVEHFIRQFKSKVGASPLTYRRNA